MSSHAEFQLPIEPQIYTPLSKYKDLDYTPQDHSNMFKHVIVNSRKEQIHKFNVLAWIS